VPDDFDVSSVTWVMDEVGLAHLIEALAQCDLVVADLETTGLDEHAVRGGTTNAGYPARIVLASFTLPTDLVHMGVPTTWILPLSHPDSPWSGHWREAMRRVAQAILDNDRPVSNANVKFDSRWVYAHTGVDLSRQIVWDTMISSHLLDENASTKLKVQAPLTFGVPPWDEFDLSKPGAAEKVPMFDLGLYAARDTYWTWRLHEKHRRDMYLENQDGERPETPDDIESAKLGRLAVWCAIPTTATLSAVEQRGFLLDTDWTRQELAEHQDLTVGFTESLCERYGLNPNEASFAPTSHWFMAWAERAVQAGDLTIAELTPTGKPRWSKGVLVRQGRAGSEVALELLSLRGHVKKAEYLVSWLNHVTPDGLIHATYNAGRVVTGRLSSDSPNMQQVTAALKPAFIPRKGYVLADLDYSQIELRVAAFISRSKPMIEAFQNGWDLHRLLAMAITGKSDPALVTAGERQAGKSANFGLLYGMSAYGFREYAETVYGVSFTPEEAAVVRQAFFTTWDGILDWHLRCVNRVQRDGQMTSPIGRVRRLPIVWDSNEKLAAYGERSAINSPVQGFASDLMQMAAASIEGYLPGVEPVPDVQIVATVHDDIVVEVPEDNWELSTKLCQERMVNIGDALQRLDCHLDVPLVAEAKVGTRWGLSDVGVVA
jgi:DNA polymerase I-like protein with 3'-5' exonuclease and polymerase domains